MGAAVTTCRRARVDAADATGDDGDAADANEDDLGLARAVRDANARAMRVREGTRAEGRLERVDSLGEDSSRSVSEEDSGAVEVALVELRSEARLRDDERLRREGLEDAGEEARLERARDGMGNEDERAGRGKRTLAVERFAVSLYAKRGGGGGGWEWVSLGRRACEPSGTADGALAPLFRDEERRRPSVAASLTCAPKWTVPAWCDAASTTFHLVIEKLSESNVALTEEDAKRAWRNREAMSERKGTPYGDATFTLLDLCSHGRERGAVVEARGRVNPNAARGASRGPVTAECVLVLTPRELTRAWRVGGRGKAQSGAREITPAGAMSFETLYDQVEDALEDANAVLSVVKFRQRKERAKSSLTSKPLAKGSKTSAPTHRLVAVDDVDLGDLDADADAPNRPLNRASRRPRRVRARVDHRVDHPPQPPPSTRSLV